ncbi:N-acetylglucosaminyl-phosphatidylinositol de-N-acetylase [Steccherinum ochraceum]|uniref:N-acetylglucosaminylphosphatidylinositol deacetylase n=1 Tax=Steccherinum ochraceum TaxID=92696 RepID=A0A4V2MXN1_9APHY|nr:N-acetylglucosaminyl-phosphatidylinositol de-N-acetylase [Steccherinum ochraceum]
MFAFSLPGLLVSLLFTLLLRPSSYNIDIFTSTEASPRILLLTAHPDDECMFFAPTLLAIQRQDPAAEIYSLCLSVGDADGLGDVRKKELEGSLDVLGIPAGRRWVLNHPQLQDNISVYWDAEVIAGVVRPYIVEHAINSVLTFDTQGISSHPNHISLPGGVAHLISSLPEHNSSTPSLRLFSLITVPLAQKYIGPLSPLLAKLDLTLNKFIDALNPTEAELRPAVPAAAVSGLLEYRTALVAMQKHWSQLVWFRWLYVSFSRYMWVNEWREVIPSTPTAQTLAAEDPTPPPKR